VLSTVARKAGWTHAPRTIPALEIEARVTPEVHARFAGVARFDFEAMEAGYGWSSRKREHLSCGILTMQRGLGGLQAKLDRYLARVGVTGVLSLERHGYVIPVKPRRGGFVRGRVLLVGDAAGFADALTGEGISIAMASARIAAQAILETRDGRVGVGVRARAASATCFRSSRSRGVSRGSRTGAADFMRAAFRARGPELTERVADVFLGTRTYRSLVARPGSYLSLLRGK
jgi:flavin-dependent dehydrogenase